MGTSVPFQYVRESDGMHEEEIYYLEYELSTGERKMLRFNNLNDRDGCYISLDMYKAQLGPVTDEVFHRIVHKFHGEPLSAI